MKFSYSFHDRHQKLIRKYYSGISITKNIQSSKSLNSCSYSIQMIARKHFSSSTSNITNKLNDVTQKSQYSFAFAGCGWLMPFHLGVIHQMKEYDIINDNTVVSGTSGGALAALIAASNMNVDDVMQKLIELSKSKTFKKDIHGQLKLFLQDALPSDSLVRCNKRLYICVTKIWPNPKNSPDIICDFQSEEYLLDVVTASCFIPLYSNSKMFAAKILSHGDLFIDGGVVAAIPPICDIKVSPIPPDQIFWKFNPTPVDIHIQKSRFPLNKLISWVLLPPNEFILRELYESGKESAKIWLIKNNIII